MADISAKDVAALRKGTGAGMMDCKRALGRSGGDHEKAKAWLRQNALSAGGQRARPGGPQGAGDGPADPKAVEVGHDVALHIASAAPRWVTRDDVPADVIEAEKAVLENLTRNEGKPEQAIPKIVEGRLGGFFKDNCLVEQGYVRDPKVTVGSLLSGLGGDAKVTRFARIKVGEE